MLISYRLSGVLLAELGLGVEIVVVVVGRVRLALLRRKLIGDGTLVLRVEVLVAALDTLVVTLMLVGDRHGLVALIASLVDGGVTDGRLTGAVHSRHIVDVDEKRRLD